MKFKRFIEEVNKKETMKKYDDCKNDIDWTKYKIVVPTEKDKKELEDAFKHIHYSDIDTDFITVNQLAHEYLNNDVAEGTHNNIIVDENLFKSIENRKG